MTVARARSRSILLGTVAGALLAGAALATSVCLLYTGPVFRALGLHPLALEVVDGVRTAAGLGAFTRDRLAFTEREIGHLMDVKAVVAKVRVAAILSAIVLALLFAARPGLMRPASTSALALYLGALALLSAAVALAGPAATFDALHRLAFEPGTFVFERHRLMSQLYGNRAVLEGAAFVAGMALVLLAAAWVLARLLAGRGLVQKGRPSRDASEGTPDP